MALSQFICPHCRSPFQVDASLPSLQVACPHCLQPVALVSEPPVSEPPVSEPPVSEPPVSEPPLTVPPVTDPPAVESGTGELPPTVPGVYSPADLLPPISTVSPEQVPTKKAEERESISDDFRSRQLVADERASRKFVKNMIVWVCCAIVLVLILAFFLMQGGS